MNVTGIKEKLGQLLTSVRSSKMLSLLGMFLIMAAIPLTVYVSQQQQEIRQRAEGKSNGQACNHGDECSSGYCVGTDDAITYSLPKDTCATNPRSSGGAKLPNGQACAYDSQCQNSCFTCGTCDKPGGCKGICGIPCNQQGTGGGSVAGSFCRHDSDCGNPSEWVCPGEDFSRQKNVPKDTCIKRTDPRLTASATASPTPRPTIAPTNIPQSNVIPTLLPSPSSLPSSTSSPSPTLATTPSVTDSGLLVGDLNKDGKVSVLDYTVLISCFGKKADMTSCSNKTIADLNNDGKVDGIDYTIFYRDLAAHSR